jgi:hypothetical protein
LHRPSTRPDFLQLQLLCRIQRLNRVQRGAYFPLQRYTMLLQMPILLQNSRDTRHWHRVLLIRKRCRCPRHCQRRRRVLIGELQMWLCRFVGNFLDKSCQFTLLVTDEKLSIVPVLTFDRGFVLCPFEKFVQTCRKKSANKRCRVKYPT